MRKKKWSCMRDSLEHIKQLRKFKGKLLHGKFSKMSLMLIWGK